MCLPRSNTTWGLLVPSPMGVSLTIRPRYFGAQQHRGHTWVLVCDCPQVYIGHSEHVQAVAFTPDQKQVLSVGDAIFFWDVLAALERQVSALDCIHLGLPLAPSDTLSHSQ